MPPRSNDWGHNDLDLSSQLSVEFFKIIASLHKIYVHMTWKAVNFVVPTKWRQQINHKTHGGTTAAFSFFKSGPIHTSYVPCEKLSRAMFIPSMIIFCNVGTALHAGPIITNIIYKILYMYICSYFSGVLILVEPELSERQHSSPAATICK